MTEPHRRPRGGFTSPTEARRGAAQRRGPKPSSQQETLQRALDQTLAVIKRYVWRPQEWEYHALTLWIAVPAGAQTVQASGETWTPPRLADGQPDVAGMWNSVAATHTPLHAGPPPPL